MASKIYKRRLFSSEKYSCVSMVSVQARRNYTKNCNTNNELVGCNNLQRGLFYATFKINPVTALKTTKLDSATK